MNVHLFPVTMAGNVTTRSMVSFACALLDLQVRSAKLTSTTANTRCA